MRHSRTMPRTPIDLSKLLTWVDDPQAAEHLRSYFEPDRAPGMMPRYSGSRFEFLAGGGDRPETANKITLDDLVAVTLLAVDVPGDVALKLLEGNLGPDVTRHLEQIPTDVSINDPAAAELFTVASPARAAWDLLEEPHGMGWVITNKLLARKRPRLIPVYDRVVRCAYGYPDGLWNWLVAMFAVDGGVLNDRLLAAREAAGVSPEVSVLRVLDVIVWMRHRPDHLLNGCPGPA
jgi:Family of unknown function (DUF6308)